MAFRRLSLPAGIKGEVHLHSIPGRYTRFSDDVAEIALKGISTVIRLTSDRETEEKSPEYWDAIKHHTIRWKDLSFAITDFGTPDSLEAFIGLLGLVATGLEGGERYLIHCAAGIGRTGTVACAILVKLGVGLDEAVGLVGEAGSQAEAPGQRNLLELLGATLRRG